MDKRTFRSALALVGILLLSIGLALQVQWVWRMWRSGGWAWVLAVLLSVLSADAQPIHRLPASSSAASLEARWESVAVERGAYWVGYSVSMLMPARSFVGSYSFETRSGIPSLAVELYGREIEPAPDGRWYDRDPTLIVKELAVLVHRPAPGAAPDGVGVSSIALPFARTGDPLYWLGPAQAEESVALLRGLFGETQSVSVREDALRAVALHRDTPPAYTFLAGVLEGRHPDALREEAAFWLSRQSDERAFTLLENTARTDRSPSVREKAVDGLGQIERAEATEVLIDLARNERVKDVRENAIFWLGQRASERVTGVLRSLTESDDIEVQKQAVHAIAQLPEARGVPLLIDIARTHPYVETRKQAIYLLSNAEDARALETIIELAGGQPVNE
jgi:hypothetical protein